MKKWWTAIDETYFRRPNSKELNLIEDFDIEKSLTHLLEKYKFFNGSSIYNENSILNVIFNFYVK